MEIVKTKQEKSYIEEDKKKKKSHARQVLIGLYRWGRWRWPPLTLGTIFPISWRKTSQEHLLPSSSSSRGRSRLHCGTLFARMISWKPVFQTNLQLASLANGCVGECQWLFASPNRTSWFLLLPWITIPRFLMPLQHHLLLLHPFPCNLNRGRTGFANDYLPALMIRFRTLVRLIRSMLQTKHLHKHRISITKT